MHSFNIVPKLRGDVRYTVLAKHIHDLFCHSRWPKCGLGSQQVEC